jgi:hypothetical protein
MNHNHWPPELIENMDFSNITGPVLIAFLVFFTVVSTLSWVFERTLGRQLVEENCVIFWVSVAFGLFVSVLTFLALN